MKKSAYFTRQQEQRQRILNRWKCAQCVYMARQAGSSAETIYERLTRARNAYIYHLDYSRDWRDTAASH